MKLNARLMSANLRFTELTVKNYKNLLKCLFGTPNKTLFVETVCDIASNSTNHSYEYFYNLNLIDLFLFLLDLRINSMGLKCEILFNNEKQNKKTKIELNLAKLRTQIYDTFNEFCKHKFEYNNFRVIFNCPSANLLLEKENTNNEIEDYLYFIEGIEMQDGRHHLISNVTDSLAIFNSLSPSNALKIIEKYKEFAAVCSDLDLFESYKLKEKTKLPFVPTIESLIWFSKIIFNDELSALYSNLFYLGHSAHIDLNYIENCSVGEYNFYVSVLQSIFASQKENQTNLNAML